jgi:TM2 domain-containing membrane protein YozV
MLTNDELNHRENALRDKIADLASDTRSEFYRRQRENLKDPDTYAVLNWFFVCGLHYFYLGRWVRGAFNLGLLLIGLAFIGSFGIPIIVLVLIIELPQLFFSQRIVRQYNLEISEAILTDLKA